MTTLKEHPLATIIPPMSADDLSQLTEDIRAHGQRVPIVLLDGLILDGRHRYKACIAARVIPQTRELTKAEGDPLAFVISQNVKRRHLNESQRAMVAAAVASLPNGVRKDRQAVQTCTATTLEESADMLNVSRRSVCAAKGVLNHGTPELVDAVRSGDMTVAQASKLIRSPAEEQNEVVRRAKTEGVSAVAAHRGVKAERIAKAEAIAPTGRYRVIYADPPWNYGNGMPPGSTRPEDHYPVMDLAEICALPVKDMAQDDAVLFLWATSPLVPESLEVIRAWGFQYKAGFVWDKCLHNMGHYNSVRHEFLWICTRGSCQPDNRKLFDSVVTEERTEHSKKPTVFYEIIDTLYPCGKRIELFARNAHEGWESFGFEAPGK